jgi:outer membrane lipoprotein-sorting protein
MVKIMTKFLFPLLPIVILVSQVFSNEPAVMKLISKKYTPGSFIEAQFQLHTWWSVREREETKKGKIFLAPQNNFRVELGNDILVSDGKTYWQYNKAGKQVIIDNFCNVELSYHPSQLLSTFLTGYSYKEAEKSATETVLKWSTDDPAKSQYKEIELRVNTKSGEVQQLKMIDRNDNIQTYIFKKTVFGAKIPKEVFTFEVPEDVQVLDNRQ